MAKHKEFRAIWVEVPAELRGETVVLVAGFATAMAQKLAKAQRKYGYGSDWLRDDWMHECRLQLYRHLKKGDPLDVANYSAFLWHHGESTAASVNADCDEVALAVAQMFTREDDPQGRAQMQCAIISAIRNPMGGVR